MFCEPQVEMSKTTAVQWCIYATADEVKRAILSFETSASSINSEGLRLAIKPANEAWISEWKGNRQLASLANSSQKDEVELKPSTAIPKLLFDKPKRLKSVCKRLCVSLLDYH